MKADHKVFSDNCESRNDHRYAVVVQDLATQMDPDTSLQNKNFDWNTKKTRKSLWSIKGNWQFLAIRQSLWRSFLESLYVHITQIKNKWDCWKSTAQKKKKKFWKRSSTENIHLGTAATNSKRKSCWFSWGIKRSLPQLQDSFPDAGEVIVDIFVHVRKLLISSSRWAKSQTLLVEKRIIPYFIRFHCRVQSNSHKFGCQVKAPHRLLMEYPWTGFTQFTSIGRKNSRRMYVVKEGLNEKTVDIQARPSMPELWKSMGRMSSWKRSKSDHMKNFNSITHEHYDGSFSLTRRIKN